MNAEHVKVLEQMRASGFDYDFDNEQYDALDAAIAALGGGQKSDAQVPVAAALDDAAADPALTLDVAREAGLGTSLTHNGGVPRVWIEGADWHDELTRFALLVRAAALEEAIKIIEEYRIPVGNSAAGELACEWTREALKEIRDAILALKEQA